jgi:DNA-binding NarL/FixJ family response regulator
MATTPAADPRPRILVVEDDSRLRAHVVGAFEAAPDLESIGSAGSVAEALALLSRAPDLILLDLGLPDGSGVRVIESVREQWPRCRVLVLTVFDDRASVLGTLKAGADGYVLKDAATADVLAYVRSTLAGETPISARAASHLLSIVRDDPVQPETPSGSPADSRSDPPSGARLSPRERELLELLARGMSRKEAARTMGISPNTVAEYVQGIYRKLQVRSRGRAVFEALQARLIDVERR